MNSQLSEPIKRTIILTGATGVVGSHVLYELLLQLLNKDFVGKIVLLVRANSKLELNANDRVLNVLSEKCIPDYLKSVSIDKLLSLIEVVECEFGKDDLSLALDAIHMEKDVYLIHSAASTNLAQSNIAEVENHEVNYKGSLKLLDSCKRVITKMIYISTVYACGKMEGIIKNEYSELHSPEFKNPYEQYKFETERELASKCKLSNIDYQILRPGVVVGRLIDAPLYFLPKYNVVYAFAAFFYSLVQRQVEECIFIRVNPKTSLHLVSVDFVAKTVAKAYSNSSIKELNIIPRFGSNESKIRLLLQTVGYSNYKFVKEHTEAQNPYQRAYQSKVAPSFEPYINDEAFEFDNEPLNLLMADYNMPNVDDQFESLIQDAVSRNFEL